MIHPLLLAMAAHMPAATAADELAANPGIPAAAVITVQCDQITIAVAGVSVSNAPARVDERSRFNIGSNAKSMLATLAATLVEEDRLSWDTTVAQSSAFSGVAIHPELRAVTLEELLSHTSGIAAFASGDQLDTVAVEGNAQEQRARFAALALAREPEQARGAYLYSNAGYVVAAEMIADAAGEPLFDALQRRVFGPLGMDAHLGEPSAVGADQPRGHTASDEGPTPLEPGRDAIPDFLDPAGNISLTPDSYGRYLQSHLCGLEGEGELLSTQSYARLHQAVGGTGYALGWAKADLPPGHASFHVGGTGAFTTIAALVPETGRGVAVMINVGGDEPRTAGIATVLELLESP